MFGDDRGFFRKKADFRELMWVCVCVFLVLSSLVFLFLHQSWGGGVVNYTSRQMNKKARAWHREWL